MTNNIEDSIFRHGDLLVSEKVDALDEMVFIVLHVSESKYAGYFDVTSLDIDGSIGTWAWWNDIAISETLVR